MSLWSLIFGKSVSVDEVHRRMAKGEKFTFVDVRTLPEVQGPQGWIPGAIHIPLRELKERAAEELGESPDPIVTVCSHGVRSKLALGMLGKLGYNGASLSGGMLAWRRKGYEVIKAPGAGQRPELSRKEC